MYTVCGTYSNTYHCTHTHTHVHNKSIYVYAKFHSSNGPTFSLISPDSVCVNGAITDQDECQRALHGGRRGDLSSDGHVTTTSCILLSAVMWDSGGDCVHNEDELSVSMATGHAYLFSAHLWFTQRCVVMLAMGVVCCRLVRCSTRSKW